MIILPSMPTWRALAPMRWQPSSQAHGIKIKFRLRARLADGHLYWTGWFDDREDVDAFVYALATGTLGNEPELWRLPTPCWHPDFADLDLTYDFANQVTFLTSPTGSNQTYNVPSDWNSSNNSNNVSR